MTMMLECQPHCALLRHTSFWTICWKISFSLRNAIYILHIILVQNKTVMHIIGSCASYGGSVQGPAGCRVPSAALQVWHGARCPALRVRHGAAGKVFPQRGTPALWPRGIPATGVGNRDLALKPYAPISTQTICTQPICTQTICTQAICTACSTTWSPCFSHWQRQPGKDDTCLKGGLTLHPLGNCLAQGSTILDKGRLECIADCINLARWI